LRVRDVSSPVSIFQNAESFLAAQRDRENKLEEWVRWENNQPDNARFSIRR
jgi:hypothetical protein